jgi:signal transduction histidine kinase
MLLVSHAIVRRMTAPLDRLVRFVSGMSPDSSARADVGDDEVGELAQSFNDMLGRLQRSQQALVRSEKLALAGLMAARVAHDIRNPLSSIKMQTQLLTSSLAADPDAVSALSAVLRDIDQLESVARDLLELARPGQFRLETASLNAVVTGTIRQLAAQFAHRKISVDSRLTADLPDVPLDQHRFRQALVNVLMNASEAMPTGGSITVATRLDESDGLSSGSSRTAVIEICDDGIGVDPALADRVFDPFVSSKRDGVGLGLVNAKAVVEGHGGRIRLTPRPGRGTCVIIEIPVKAATASGGA